MKFGTAKILLQGMSLACCPRFRLNVHEGGCQNYGPFLGTLDIRCRIITGIQNGPIILTTTHVSKLDAGLRERPCLG